MHSTPVIFSALALFGMSHSAPVAAADSVVLPAPAEVQNQIISLQATIVYLTNDIVQTNQENGKNDWNTANTSIQNLASAVITPPDACPPPTGMGRISDAQTAIESLNYTQNYLSQLSLDLQNTGSSSAQLLNDYCYSLGGISGIQYYIFNILGTSANGASNEPVANSFNDAGYDPNKLGQTYTAALVALEALISALNNDSTGKAAATKTAYDNAQDALATFGSAAAPDTTNGCPYVKFPAVHDSATAIDYAKSTEQAVQSAYSDTVANNGNALLDFCKIDSFMTAVDTWVQTA